MSVHQAYQNKMVRKENPFAGPRGYEIQAWRSNQVYAYSWNKDNPFQEAVYDAAMFYATGEVGGALIGKVLNFGKGVYLSNLPVRRE